MENLTKIKIGSKEQRELLGTFYNTKEDYYIPLWNEKSKQLIQKAYDNTKGRTAEVTDIVVRAIEGYKYDIATVVFLSEIK